MEVPCNNQDTITCNSVSGISNNKGDNMNKRMTKYEILLWEHDCYPLDKITADAIADVKRTEETT